MRPRVLAAILCIVGCKHSNSEHADLGNADLSGASGVDLSNADLTGLDLIGVDLNGADLATVIPSGTSCSAQTGSLHLSAQVVRGAGISPLLAFFDATATTDSAAATSVAQDVTFTWRFGDSGASGSGTWSYGSRPAANSMNEGSGIVSAHLYRTAGSDTSYAATVTATDGTNTASCAVGVTAYDPNGSNGFPGNATTCVSSSTTPTAGAGGCPAGAKVLKTASVDTALTSAYGAGKRLLFKCGDTFTGDDGGNPNVTAVKASIGAYGGCEDTQAGRPVLSNSGANHVFQMSGTTGDNRFSDLDCEGNLGSNGGCIWSEDGSDGVMYQNTIYNVSSSKEVESFFWNQCSQCGLVQSVMNGMGNTTSNTWIGVWVNGDSYANYPYSGNPFNNLNYQAVIGNHFDGGTTYYNNNAETLRVFACADCYIADNDLLNAGPYYAVLKLHDGNQASTWAGVYTEYVEVSDNYFAGTSGANLVELEPQGSTSDERLRYIVAERNVAQPTGNTTEECIQLSATYSTIRDNAMLTQGAYGIQVGQRGIEPVPNLNEIYNNTIQYRGVGNAPNSLIEINGTGGANPTMTYVKNNLGYDSTGSVTMVDDGGNGSVISNNTTTVTNNPAFTDASGTFRNITDYKPTAYYSGGVAVPVWYDGLGVAWSPSWDLGAVHH